MVDYAKKPKKTHIGENAGGLIYQPVRLATDIATDLVKRFGKFIRHLLSYVGADTSKNDSGVVRIISLKIK